MIWPVDLKSGIYALTPLDLLAASGPDRNLETIFPDRYRYLAERALV